MARQKTLKPLQTYLNNLTEKPRATGDARVLLTPEERAQLRQFSERKA